MEIDSKTEKKEKEYVSIQIKTRRMKKCIGAEIAWLICVSFFFIQKDGLWRLIGLFEELELEGNWMDTDESRAINSWTPTSDHVLQPNKLLLIQS